MWYSMPLPWKTPAHKAVPLEIVGDSELVVGWMNGETNCSDAGHAEHVEYALTMLHNAWVNSEAAPRQSHTAWLRHVYRELKSEADAMATDAILSGNVSSWSASVLPTKPPKFVRVFFDGGLRDNMASYGYALYAVFEEDCEGDA